MVSSWVVLFGWLSGAGPPALPAFGGATATSGDLVVFGATPLAVPNRRLRVVWEGVELAEPVMGLQEWDGASLAPVRVTFQPVPAAGDGAPGSAAGVLEATPSPGATGAKGWLRVEAGERGAAGLALGLTGATRWQGRGEFSLGVDRDQGFRRSRDLRIEAPGDVLEAVPLARAALGRGAFGFRWRGGGPRQVVGFDLRAAERRGALHVTPLGRLETGRARETAWVARWSDSTYQARVDFVQQEREGQRLLTSGVELPWQSRSAGFAGRVSQPLAGARAELTGGVEARVEELSSPRPGRFLGPESFDHRGAFLRLTTTAGAHWSGHLLARYDEGERWSGGAASGRLAFAWAPTPGHQVELSWGRGVVAPSLADLTLELPAGPDLDFGAIERAFGLDLGFARVPLVARGHSALMPEVTTGFDLSYRGQWGPRWRLDVALFQHRTREVVGGFAPGGGPSLPPYQVPASVPPLVASRFLAALRALVPGAVLAGLTQGADGRPLVVLARGQGGDVELRGGTLAARWSHPAERWYVALRGAANDFLVTTDPPGAPLASNQPENRAELAAGAQGARWSAQLRYRWQAAVEWVNGVFQGVTPEYQTADLAVVLELNPAWRTNLWVTRLTGERGVEVLGGDLLGRQARLEVSYSW